MIPQEFLKAVAHRVGISENEYEVLAKAIEGEPVSTISTKLGVRADALQKRLGEVYKKFKITGAGPGKLAKLQQILMSEYQKQVADRDRDLESDCLDRDSPRVRSNIRADWGKAPTPSPFYGRGEELIALQQWIVEDKCRVVMLLGPGGIGKTALALRFARQIQDSFDTILWRSLAPAPPIGEFLADLLRSLDAYSGTYFSEETDKQISQLIRYLRGDRCLLILDGIESILQNGGRDRISFEGYNELFKQVAESRHNSCLILTSWDTPPALSQPIEESLAIRLLELKGLPEESAVKLIDPSPFIASSENDLISELVHLYAGNPQLLKMVANHFPDLFSGNLAQFIKQLTLTVSNLVREFLTRYPDRPSQLEIDAICWVASHGKPATQKDLEESILFSDKTDEVIDALDCLWKRSLIDKITQNQEIGFALNSEIRKSVTHQLLAKYLNQIGSKKYLEGEFVSAKASLKEAIRYNPEFAHAQYNLGSAYEKLEEVDRARKHYQIAASFNNRAAHAAINNLARLEILNGNIDDSIDLILPILSQVTDNTVKAALYKNLGWAYLVQNRYDEAEKHLQQAIELNPAQTPAHCLLAQVLEAKGDRQAALTAWKSCLIESPVEEKAEKVAWRLPELDIWRIQAHQYLNPSR